MAFGVGAALLDAIVLAVVAIDISESTLYPVLRRLQKDQNLVVYDVECGGRNRRYYKLTKAGAVKLQEYKVEWNDYSTKISNLLLGEEQA